MRAYKEGGAATATEMQGAIVVTSEKDLRSKLDPATRPMVLEGTETQELYLAQIERNLEALAEQIGLLQAALEERKEASRRIVACLVEREELLHDWNRTGR